MKIELRLKYLFYVCQKERDRGFTIIDVVVAIAILGLLTLATLPSHISQAQNNREAEGRLYVSSINKAQQAFYLENGKFVTENSPQAWASLGLGIKTQTANYKYSISPSGTSTQIVGVNAFADATQIDINKRLRNYTGVVGLIAPDSKGKKITKAVVCESKTHLVPPMIGTITSTTVECPLTANKLP